jgi:hypothetical protein
MNLKQKLVLLALVFTLPYFNGYSQETNSEIESAMVEKQFVILKSTRDYKEALLTAQKVSKSLKLKLDLRGLSENKEIGLTFDRKSCEEEGGYTFPCYVARGRSDDGDYISIEYSSNYEGFTKGYYIVIASSHIKNSKEIPATLKLVKTYYKDAYVKTAKVYVGCMH